MFNWTCEICGFVASTPAERDTHKANPGALHTEDLIDAAINKMHNAVMDVITKYVPADIEVGVVAERANIIRAVLNSSRTTALGCLIHGALTAASTGLSEDQAVKLVQELYSTATASEVVRDHAMKYMEMNAFIKQQHKAKQEGGPFVLPPQSDLKH